LPKEDAQKCAALIDALSKTKDALDKIKDLLGFTDDKVKLCFPFPGPPDPEFPNKQSQDQKLTPVTSFDPNEKIGPAGIGPAGAISGDLLPYTIFFENLASATAPAQEISITDRLAPALDVNTAFLGTLRVGGTNIELGSGQHASKTVDLRPSTNALLQVQADVDTVKRQITWVMTALDPATGQLPSDPQVGILPPNRNPPAGEGIVTFGASAKAGTPEGTAITNQATITRLKQRF